MPVTRIGVISDTHGLLRPGVRGAFDGVEHILHAGDVDQSRVLDGLRAIAPVTAVRGNMDSYCDRMARADKVKCARRAAASSPLGVARKPIVDRVLQGGGGRRGLEIVRAYSRAVHQYLVMPSIALGRRR